MVRLGDIPDSNFETKPVGWYSVVIKKAKREMGKSEPYNPYIHLDMVIIDGKYKKSHLFKNIVLTEKALTFLKPFLLAIGYSKKQDIKVDEEGYVIVNESRWEGEQLQVHIKHKMYEGEQREEVDAYKAADEIVNVDEFVPNTDEADNEDEEEIPF